MAHDNLSSADSKLYREPTYLNGIDACSCEFVPSCSDIPTLGLILAGFQIAAPEI